MLKRLLVGLVLGAVLGGIVAAVLVQGLGMQEFGTAVTAYLAAAATGALAGLVAGKPIWSADGKIEAGLKAFFGVLLGLGGMFALRQWVHVDVDLTAVKAGSGSVGNLPAASLPLVAAVLAGFFELDNTPSAEGDKKALPSTTEKSADGKKVRVAKSEEADEEDVEEPAAAKRKR